MRGRARAVRLRRGTAAFLLVACLALLAAVNIAETRFGFVPCALCLLERWPYRVGAVLAALMLVLPYRWLALPLLATLLAEVGLAATHVGVEQGWWPSPLPECAARLPAGDLATRLSGLPSEPSKPCDEPTYPLPGLPVSFAAANLAAALVLAGVARRAI